MTNADWLAAPLGDHLVLARPGPQPGKGLHVLNPLAAWIWHSARAGLTPDEIASALAEQFARPSEATLAEVHQLLDAWRRPPPPMVWTRPLADRAVTLTVDDPELAIWLATLLPPGPVPVDPAAPVHLHLTGTAAAWQLVVDGAVTAIGQTGEEALLQVRSALMTAGCDTTRRLLVLHAAGVSRAGQGLLLIGTGGVGKTTLAIALNAHGWALLNDDVIPVTLDGQLLGLGLAPCLKAGSWPVLADVLPTLDQLPMFQRFDQAVRFPLPPGPVVYGPLPAAAFLIPRYQPDGPSGCAPLSPVAVLQAILAAEAVLPTLDQDRLNALTRWVSAAPGFALTYPDLDAALGLIEDLPLAGC